MKKSEIHKIIVKFLNKEANATELEVLESWLRRQDVSSDFNRFVGIEFLATLCMEKYDVKKAKKLIKQRLEKKRRKKRMAFFKRTVVAASILLIIGMSCFQLNNFFDSKQQTITTSNAIVVGTDKAVLTFDNGDQVSLEKGKSFQKNYVTVNGDKLVYKQNGKITTPKEKLVYNYLTIPRGGQYFVVLADGTKVWLNSESKLKFPVKFLEGKTRNVELVYGEAYFEVSPSSKHKGAKFNVLTMHQQVDVLGTEFNIKAYKEESEIITTLVEGKIAIQKGSIKKEIKPNQQSKINHNSNSIDIIEVDASQEVSWVKGLFTFNEASLDDMMKELSRWYDTEVVFENANKKQFVFTGVLERSKNIEEILDIITATSEGEMVFEVKNKTIIIK